MPATFFFQNQTFLYTLSEHRWWLFDNAERLTKAQRDQLTFARFCGEPMPGNVLGAVGWWARMVLVYAPYRLCILVGDTVATATEHVRKAIADDSITLDLVDVNEPSPVSPTDDPAFELITATIEEVFEDAVPTPYVMMAATDSRYFTAICPRVYRFTPFRMTKAQRESIHSYDEHIGVQDFLDGVRWYTRLIERLPS